MTGGRGRGARADWAALGARYAAAATLVAAVTVPLFVVPAASQPFEEMKVLLLRLLATGALAAGILAVGGRSDPRRNGAREGVAALGLCGIGAALYLGASLAAALCSELPAAALPGDYLRQAGLLTDLALAGVFLGGVAIARGALANALLIDAMRAAGAVLALVALLEPLGFGPIVPEGARASSLAGGPTYLGAALAALLPATLLRVEHKRDLALVTVFVLALLLTASRVALLAALLAIVPLLRARRELRRPALRVVLLGLAALAILALPPLASHLPADALPNRLARLFAGDGLRGRLLLYRDAFDAIASSGARIAFGHGPDTIGSLFTTSISDALQRTLGGATRVDRFHSDVLDLVFTRGIFALAGMALMIVAALRRARAGHAGALGAALAGTVLACAFDGAFSVPSAFTRLLLFLAAGWLAASGDQSLQTERASSGTAAPSDTPAGAEPFPQRGALLGAAAVTIVAAVLPRLAPFALLGLLPLVPRGRRLLTLVPGLIALSALLGVRFMLGGAGDLEGAHHAFFHAERARIETGALIGLVVIAAAAIAFARSRKGEAPRFAPARSTSKAIAALVALAAPMLFVDDTARALAYVDAGAATLAQGGGGSPEQAAALLREASRRAPEVARFHVRRALALTDVAATADVARRTSLVTEVGTEIGLALGANRKDAFVPALGALCVLRFSRLFPDDHVGLDATAATLAEEALERAPRAPQVLEIAAEARLRVGRVDGAEELLRRARKLDATRPRVQLLLGRAAAMRGDLKDAAIAYGEAIRLGAPVPEAHAALAYAAAAKGETESAAAILALLARQFDRGVDLDVEGARPLLTFVAWDQLDAAFAEAARRAPAAAVHALRERMDY